MRTPLFLILWLGLFHGSKIIDLPEIESNQPDVCLTQNEIELGRIIDSYRLAHNLKAIPLSGALTKVAQAHVKDRALNSSLNQNDRCNMHSWSDKGVWKECCYFAGSDGACMWDKPKEIAGYKGDGYEIIMVRINSEAETQEVSASEALKSWKGSPRHNNVILNRDIWKRMDWQAMGIGIYQGYASVWFGVEKDGSGVLKSCQ